MPPMRVLLINTNTKADMLAAPPIGAACVATAAAAAGHDVRLLDLCFERDRDRAIARHVASFHPEVVGLSIRNLDNVNLLRPVSYVDDARRVAEAVRALTTAPLVLGGSGTSICPREMLRALQADYVVAGDGESTFVALLEAIAARRPPQGIPGVWFSEGGTIRFTPPAFTDPSFGDPHLERWVDVAQYHRMSSSYTVQTKRGCCQHCTYCTYNQSLEGRTLRLRPPADVVGEIERAVVEHGVTEFEFVDSVFNEPIDHCREILERIVRSSWKARFTAMGMSPRHMDEPFLALLWEAGFRSFMMTPDSASEPVIRRYGKGFHAEDLASAATALGTTGFTVMWLFLVGGPGETHETIDETLEFIRRHLVRSTRPPNMFAYIFFGVRVYPGTSLWETAVREGLVAPDSDPLQSLWYVAPRLDLDRAVGQLVEASRRHPEVSLGFDERYLNLSSLLAGVGSVLPLAKPYWRHLPAFNRLLNQSGLRRMLRPRHLADQVRQVLESGRGSSGSGR